MARGGGEAGCGAGGGRWQWSGDRELKKGIHGTLVVSPDFMVFIVYVNTLFYFLLINSS